MNMPHHHMHHAWSYGASGDKIDPHYYYPAWSETQFPCVAPTYGGLMIEFTIIQKIIAISNWYTAHKCVV